MREHGCHSPYSRMQVSAWFLKGFLACATAVLIIPFIPVPAVYIVAAIFAILLFCTIGSGMYVSLSNPSDPNVTIVRGKNREIIKLPRGKRVIDEFSFCMFCNVKVNKLSKHCKICDKCVDVFDHHCKWLNNCVGKSNYRLFLVYICVTLLTALFNLALAVYLFVQYFIDKSYIIHKLKDLYHTTQNTFFVSLVGVLIVLELPVIYLLGDLVVFHIRLAYHKTTTYAYITQYKPMKSAQKSERKKHRKPPRPICMDWPHKRLFRKQSVTALTSTEVTPSPSLSDIPQMSSDPYKSPGKSPETFRLRERTSSPHKERQGFEGTDHRIFMPPIFTTEEPPSATILDELNASKGEENESRLLSVTGAGDRQPPNFIPSPSRRRDNLPPIKPR